MTTGLARHIPDRMLLRRMPSVHTADLVVTEACSLRCDYCFLARKQSSRRMSWRVAKRAVDWLFEMSGDEPVVQLTFFGGEPLMALPLMERTAEYANDCGRRTGKRVEYAITTNGTAISTRALEFARRNGALYLLSIDGLKAAHDLHRKRADGSGSWDAIVHRALPRLKACQGWVGARLTVSPDTVEDLAPGVRLLFAKGVNQFIIGPNRDVLWTSEQLLALERGIADVGDFYLAQLAAGG